MNTLSQHPASAAVLGSVLLSPFLVLNAIVGNRIEPFFSLIRPNVHTSVREYVLLATVLLLLPIGAFIAASPLFRKRADGARRFLIVNAAVAVALVAVFVVVSVALGSDIYRCDIQQIPNCD